MKFIIILWLVSFLNSCLEIETPWSSKTSECVKTSDSYNRSEHFGSWIDADGDGLNTRFEVLVAENLGTLTIDVDWSGRSVITGGVWYCPFTGEKFTQPSDLDIDHMIPLKEAWESGACFWSQKNRVEFANELDDAGHLIAVYNSANRSKGASDPSEWLPTNESYQQTYIQEWIRIKKKWGLTADEDEYQFLLSNENYYSRSLGSDFQLTTCYCN